MGVQESLQASEAVITVANRVQQNHYGKVASNTVEYTTAFLYSDWLYFLWQGIIVN